MSSSSSVEGEEEEEEARISSAALVTELNEDDECGLLMGNEFKIESFNSTKTMNESCVYANYSTTAGSSRSANTKHFLITVLSYLNFTNQFKTSATQRNLTLSHNQYDHNHRHQKSDPRISYNFCEDEDESGSSSTSGRSNKKKQHQLKKGTLNLRQQDESSRRRILFSGTKRKIRLILLTSLSFFMIISTLFLLIELVSLLQEYRTVSERYFNMTNVPEPDQLRHAKASRWLVANPKCHIPAIDPWHESIAGYVELKPPVNCSELMRANKSSIGTEAFTYVRENRLFITEHAIMLGAYSRCCLRQIKRVEDSDSELVYNETCHPIYGNGIWAPFELIQVECSTLNYTNVHSFTWHNPDEEAALDRLASRKLQTDKYYNVLMVGIDTISRLNGMRQLNKTLTLLKEKYGAIDFKGYNKVGENTFPNLIPFLTGLTPEQLTETQCWLASNYSSESESGDDYLDSCKFLWNYYQDFGYMTYYSEDWAKASTFNYLKRGFKWEPTVYYKRPYMLARDNLLLPPVTMGCTLCQLDKPIVELDLDNLKNFLREQSHRPFFAFNWINCPPHDDLNGASQVDVILEKFFREVQQLTQDDRTFVIFFSDHGYRWNNFVSTRVGHYESSLPLLTISPPKKFLRDHPDLVENLRKHQSALLTPFDMFKTLVDLRNLGAKSSGLKSMLLQRMTRVAVSKSLALSSSELATSLASGEISLKKPVTEPPANAIEDALYATQPTAVTTVKQLELYTGVTYKQRFSTISLLKNNSQIELDRSCLEAGIPDNYCVCHEFEKANKHELDVLGATYYLVFVHLYNRVKGNEKICHFLDLEAIHEAEMFDFKHMKSTTPSPGKSKRQTSAEDGITRVTTAAPISTSTRELVVDEHHFLPNREYNLRISTKPGGALFQEVIRYYGKSIESCKNAVKDLKNSFKKTSVLDYQVKNQMVMEMNEVCKFSVHSDSISRLNLYKEQSKCVKSNIELKKICYCKNQ